jgi:sec-independent protein translocase protein TatC
MALFRNSGKSKTDSSIDLPTMSFGDHLTELRKRLILALLGSAIGISLCLYYDVNIIEFLYQPYLIALKWAGYPPHLQYFKALGSIIVYFTTALKAGLVVSSPWIIYQFWRFVASGLYPRERKLVYKYIGPSAVLFLLGVAFFFFLILPFLLKFIMEFNQQVQVPPLRPTWWETFLYPGKLMPHPSAIAAAAKPLIIPVLRHDPTHFKAGVATLWFNATDGQLRLHVGHQLLEIAGQPAKALFAPIPMLHDYLSFVTIMSLIFGIAFELPMVMLILSKIGVVSAAQFRSMWRYAVLGLAIVAVVLAPSPDIFTFASIYIPLLSLYGAGLVMATVAGRPKPEPEPEESTDSEDTSEA